MSFGKNQLANISNNNLIGNSSKIFRKNEGQHARSAARELELQQKLRIQNGLKEKENNNNNNGQEEFNKHVTTIQLTDAELSAKKKEFTHCVFYLDNLEASAKASLERAIVLLGATQEKFFSNKCTHLITTKSIPIQENMLRSYSDTTKQRYKKALEDFKPRDSIVENALSWGIVVWSAEVMLKTVDYFMKASPFKNKNKQLQKRALGKVLQEEKLFGPSTGVNIDSNSRRPYFVPFTGHYILVEDASHGHRPVVARQYTEKIFEKKPADLPWPYLKYTPAGKSPFGKRVLNTTLKENKQTPQVNQTTRQANPMKPMAVNLDTHSLRASGYQKSCTNTTRSVSIALNEKRLPVGEKVNRLDKRMVNNITQQEQKLPIKEDQIRKDKTKEKKKELRYCENCNCQFEKLEQHLQDKTHQTFVRDKNNFKALDILLDSIRRPYKEPLPDHWKNLIDVKVDGNKVKFVSDLKRARPIHDDIINEERPNKILIPDPFPTTGWAANHYDVFLS